MPIITENIKEGECPYCYNGTLAYDKYSNKVHCTYCNKAIIVEGLN